MTRLQSLKDFIRHWYEAAGMADFCQRTGLNPREASNTAAYLRRCKRLQINLPAMQSTKKRERCEENLTIDECLGLQKWAKACVTALVLRQHRKETA